MILIRMFGLLLRFEDSISCLEKGYADLAQATTEIGEDNVPRDAESAIVEYVYEIPKMSITTAAIVVFHHIFAVNLVSVTRSFSHTIVLIQMKNYAFLFSVSLFSLPLHSSLCIFVILYERTYGIMSL